MKVKYKVRNHVTFEATGFNTSEEKDEFINMSNYGKDIAEWLVSELQCIGLTVDPKIGQEDYGWHFTFIGKSGIEYDFTIGRYENHTWLGWFERSLGLFKSMFRLRNKRISQEDLLVFHQILKQSDRVTHIRWHFQDDFMKGNEDSYSNEP